MSRHKNHLRLFIWALICLLMQACKAPEPNPELRDPIFADMNAQATSYRSKIEAQKKKIESLKEEIEKMAPRDNNRKRAINEKYNLERGLVQLKQGAEYFEIRAEQRKAYVAQAYLKAFNADKPWPDPQEFADYKEFQKLRNAPRNWDSRVPKATKYGRVDPNQAPKKTEAKSEGHGEAKPASH